MRQPQTFTLLTLVTLLVACGSPRTEPVPVLSEPDPAGLANTVNGTIGGWAATGTATIETQYRPSGSTDPGTFVTLSTGTVDAAGNFSITLPTAQQVAPYLQQFQQGPRQGCTGQFLQSAPSAAHFRVSSYTLRKPDNTILGYLIQENPGGYEPSKPGSYLIYRYYVTQSGTVRGTLACPTFKATLNLNLKAGWNAVVFTPTEVTPEGNVFAYTLETRAQLPAFVF